MAEWRDSATRLAQLGETGGGEVAVDGERLPDSPGAHASGKQAFAQEAAAADAGRAGEDGAAGVDGVTV